MKNQIKFLLAVLTVYTCSLFGQSTTNSFTSTAAFGSLDSRQIYNAIRLQGTSSNTTSSANYTTSVASYTLALSNSITCVTFSFSTDQITTYTLNGIISGTNASCNRMSDFSVSIPNGNYELISANFQSTFNAPHSLLFYNDTLTSMSPSVFGPNVAWGYGNNWVENVDKYCGQITCGQSNRVITNGIIYDYVFSSYGVSTNQIRPCINITKNVLYLVFASQGGVTSIPNQRHIVKLYFKK